MIAGLPEHGKKEEAALIFMEERVPTIVSATMSLQTETGNMCFPAIKSEYSLTHMIIRKVL